MAITPGHVSRKVLLINRYVHLDFNFHARVQTEKYLQKLMAHTIFDEMQQCT